MRWSQARGDGMRDEGVCVTCHNGSDRAGETSPVGTDSAQTGPFAEVRWPADDVERLDIDPPDFVERPTPPKQRDEEGGKPDVLWSETHRMTRHCG